MSRYVIWSNRAMPSPLEYVRQLPEKLRTAGRFKLFQVHLPPPDCGKLAGVRDVEQRPVGRSFHKRHKQLAVTVRHLSNEGVDHLLACFVERLQRDILRRHADETSLKFVFDIEPAGI